MENSNNNNKYEYRASGNAPLLFPTELVAGSFICEDLSTMDIPVSSPFEGKWGATILTHPSPEKFNPAPKFILISWLSLVEKKFYAVADELPQEQIATLLAEKNEETKKPKYNTLIAGMAPYGKLAIWLSGNGITTEVAWLQGKEISMEMKDFKPKSELSKEKYAENELADCKEALKNFQKNGSPTPTLFENYMQKFNYCITPKFNNANFESIELYYYNGELNTIKTNEYDSVMMRAKPSKIVLNWNVGKTRYGGYFWTDEIKIMDAFKNCYGNDVQKEGEFIIQVEESHDQFRFFLKNSNASIEIPTEDMQYIIFKNKLEFCRSKNYKKPKGGWRN